MKKIILIALLATFISSTFSQNYSIPVLDMYTNTRLRGFGEVGVVSSPFYKNTGAYQNPALISKNSKHAGIDVFHMPWMINLADDINISGFIGYYAMDSTNAVAVNFSYFDYGDIMFANEYGEPIGENNSYDLFFKMGYKHSFNNSISAGIALIYFRSDVVPANYENSKVVNSFAVDLGLNYDKQYSLSNSSFLNTSAGLAINNLGPKVTYTDDKNKKFIPTKLSLGLFINPDINIKNKFRLNIELGYQAEKLLVPSKG